MPPRTRTSRHERVRRYRLICMNADNGHMEVLRHFEATNDTAAIQLADGWRNSRVAELWRSYSVVMHWKTAA